MCFFFIIGLQFKALGFHAKHQFPNEKNNDPLPSIALNIGITTSELQSQMESQHHMKRATFYENFRKINDKLNIENKKISLKPEL